ncbi:MAG: hypothetical protein JNM84_13100 [Planctomycetes bacterium]|nr:hypothetical protein [Planctomycetota bacterium]
MSRALLVSSALALCGALAAPGTFAQTIAWGPVQPALAASDVSLLGTLVVARNLHGAGAAISPTVNGVNFVGNFAPNGWTNAGTLAMNGSTTGDAGYTELLDAARATSFGSPTNQTGWGAIRIDNLGVLNVGRRYLVQCWFTDQRTGTPTNVLYDRVMTLSSAIGAATLSGGEVQNLGALTQGPSSGSLEADPDNNPALGGPDLVFGSHCIGTFTRTNAADPLWLLVRGTHPIPGNVLRPHLSALQIRELPAGSAYATATAYGTGCAGATPLGLSTTDRPVIGGNFTVTTTNITPGSLFGTVAVGLVVFAPPIDLTLFDMPGCFLYHDSVFNFGYIPGGASFAQTTFPVPTGIPGLIGAEIQMQSYNFDPTASLTPLGVVTSNSLRVVCGDL